MCSRSAAASACTSPRAPASACSPTAGPPSPATSSPPCSLAVVRGGGTGADLEWNGAVVWSLFGFVVAVGVQSVSVAFPIALAFGTTRRTFTLGTLAAAAIESALLTAAALVLLGLERVTGGWFVGARVLADATLGGGDPLALVAVMGGCSLTALSVGALHGAAFVRFGARGPAVLGIVTAGLLAVLLLVALPAVPAIAAALGAWALVLIGAVVVAVSVTGEYVLLRRASVREVRSRRERERPARGGPSSKRWGTWTRTKNN